MAGLVLDASVLIALYNDNDSNHRWAVDLLFQNTSKKFLMSALNLAEVSVQPIRLAESAEAPLATCDRRQAKAAKSLGLEVFQP